MDGSVVKGKNVLVNCKTCQLLIGEVHWPVHNNVPRYKNMRTYTSQQTVKVKPSTTRTVNTTLNSKCKILRSFIPQTHNRHNEDRKY